MTDDWTWMTWARDNNQKCEMFAYYLAEIFYPNDLYSDIIEDIYNCEDKEIELTLEYK